MGTIPKIRPTRTISQAKEYMYKSKRGKTYKVFVNGTKDNFESSRYLVKDDGTLSELPVFTKIVKKKGNEYNIAITTQRLFDNAKVVIQDSIHRVLKGISDKKDFRSSTRAVTGYVDKKQNDGTLTTLPIAKKIVEREDNGLQILRKKTYELNHEGIPVLQTELIAHNKGRVNAKSKGKYNIEFGPDYMLNKDLSNKDQRIKFSELPRNVLLLIKDRVISACGIK